MDCDCEKKHDTRKHGVWANAEFLSVIEVTANGYHWSVID